MKEWKVGPVDEGAREEAWQREQQNTPCRCGHPLAMHDGPYGGCREYKGHGQSCTCAGYRQAVTR